MCDEIFHKTTIKLSERKFIWTFFWSLSRTFNLKKVQKRILMNDVFKLRFFSLIMERLNWRGRHSSEVALRLTVQAAPGFNSRHFGEYFYARNLTKSWCCWDLSEAVHYWESEHCQSLIVDQIHPLLVLASGKLVLQKNRLSWKWWLKMNLDFLPVVFCTVCKMQICELHLIGTSRISDSIRIMSFCKYVHWHFVQKCWLFENNYRLHFVTDSSTIFLE